MLAVTALGTLLLLQAPQAAPAQDPKNETKEQKAERQHQEDLKKDAEMGKKYAADADKELKPTDNKEYLERVQRIGAGIAAIANKTPVRPLWGDKRLNPFEYTFKVVKGDDVNAFSLPGGTIYVYEGLMKEIESDDELAGVLAHEVSHAEQRHVATLQRESGKLQNITLPLVLLAILTGGASAAGTAMTAGSLFMQSSGSGWSVKAEESADYGGFQYLLKSPYDPTGMLTFMERLARKNQLSDNLNWGIYKTHPPSKERAETLIGYMQAAHVPIRRSHVAASFRATTQDAPNGETALRYGGKTLATFGGPDGKARASAAIPLVNAFFDTTPQLYDLKKGDNGEIMGAGKVLFRLTPADAIGTTVATEQAESMKAMQLAMYSIGTRIWDR